MLKFGARHAFGKTALAGLKSGSSIGAGVLSAGIIAIQDYKRKDLTTGQKVSRAAGAGLGSWGGAALGAAIGTAIAPGIGTALGAAIGGFAGSQGGKALGTEIGKIFSSK